MVVTPDFSIPGMLYTPSSLKTYTNAASLPQISPALPTIFLCNGQILN